MGLPCSGSHALFCFCPSPLPIPEGPLSIPALTLHPSGFRGVTENFPHWKEEGGAQKGVGLHTRKGEGAHTGNIPYFSTEVLSFTHMLYRNRVS